MAIFLSDVLKRLSSVQASAGKVEGEVAIITEICSSLSSSIITFQEQM